MPLEGLKIKFIFMSNRLVQYIVDSKKELHKVVWPTKQQAIRHTALVIGFSLVLAIFLGVIDFGLNKLLEMVI